MFLSSRHRRRATFTALVLAALAAAVPVGGRTAVAATPHAIRRRPNILFVLADDLDLAELRALPHVRALIATPGTTFDQYLVSNSLCCPSRTTTLRGQYAHNTGVWTNGGDNGGFERAHATGVRGGHRRHPPPPGRVHDRRSPAST